MARALGMAARRRGDGVADNPYSDEIDCADAWLLGWLTPAQESSPSMSAPQ